MKVAALALAMALCSTPASAGFKGAMVHKTTSDSEQVVASDYFGDKHTPWTRVEFSSVDYDFGGFFDAGNNEFVVPPGVNLVRLTAQIVFGHDSTGARQALITKNGALFDGYAAQNAPAFIGTTPDMNVSTAVLRVVPGDRFQLVAWQVQSDKNETTTLNPSGGTWFAIEAIEP